MDLKLHYKKPLYGEMVLCLGV